MATICVSSSSTPSTSSFFVSNCNLSHKYPFTLYSVPKLLISLNASATGLSLSTQMRKSVSPLLQIRSRFIPQRRGNRGFFFSSKAGVGDNSPTAGVPTSVPVRQAYELLQSGHRYLDVRTTEEFSAGRVTGATNIPYMFKVSSGMTKNTKFLEEISTHFGKDDQIIVGCLSGKRSLMAACDLQAAGYTGITDIAGGYAAWAQNGLPTES